MAWRNINGRRYYYRSRRVGGRVETTYLGSGEIASLMARIDEIDRMDREAERSEEREEREQADAEENAVDHWFHRVQAVADAAMAEAGFHKHRGQWRKKRG